ncbi:MAG: hypothetical protein II453_14980 [Alphaproteobacteria bacterium]|nr:hypothetical protein [Alphaproteobacteria bacterium]
MNKDIDVYKTNFLNTFDEAVSDIAGGFNKLNDNERKRMDISRKLLDYETPIEDEQLEKIAEILEMVKK